MGWIYTIKLTEAQRIELSGAINIQITQQTNVIATLLKKQDYSVPSQKEEIERQYIILHAYEDARDALFSETVTTEWKNSSN
ncbi:hypothetical protein Barb4_04015 [Bacteroidales bacterium Barb4]|nr:hypothetical protein Barb4_04015 [Bacteroidales bacterium Barb4]